METNSYTNDVFLARFDIYGSKPQLRIGNKGSQKSVFGFILTILSIILFLFLIGYFGSNLFNYTNPVSVLSTTYTDNPPEINLDKNSFRIIFGIENSATYAQFNDESVYRIEVFQSVHRRISTGNTTEMKTNYIQIEIEPCNINKFSESDKNVFKNLPLPNMYCFKNENFTLQGYWFSPSNLNLFFKVYPCINSTDPGSVVCKPQKEIDKLLNFAYFSFSYTDVSVDPANYTTPKQVFDGAYYTSVSNNYYTSITHEMKSTNITTDQGWLLPDKSSSKFLQTDNIKVMRDFNPRPILLDYTFRLSKRIDVYNRSYTKIQDVVAQAGGIAKLILMICQGLTFFNNKSIFYQTLANFLYDFDFSSHNSNFNPHTVKQNINENSDNNPIMHQQKQILTKLNKNFKVKISENSNFTLIKNKNNKLNLGFLALNLSPIFPCCFSKNKQAQTLKKVKLDLEKQLDIVYILKELKEIERLKKIVLDDDMLKLIDVPFMQNFNLIEPNIKVKTLDSNIKHSYNLIKFNSEGKKKYKRLIDVLDLQLKQDLENEE